MIKESIQQTVKLIETIYQVEPNTYSENKREIEDLVQHMKIVTIMLNKEDP